MTHDMIDQSPAQEAVVGLSDEPQAQATRFAQDWPETRAEFGALVHSFQDPLVRYAFRRLGRLQDAEDVVQEVFVRAYTRVGRAGKVRSVTAYLYRMTTNACADVLRRRKRAGVPLGAVQSERIPDHHKSARDEAAATEELLRIDAMLRHLPPRQAEVIRLRVLDELRFAEIAEVLGCSAATVKSRFRYGLEKLRALVKEQREVGR